MRTDAFSWLHLTDFHYGLRGQDCLWPTLRQPFLDSLDELHDHCGRWDAVLFTGDLVQSGKSGEFAEMQAEVLGRLWDKLKELGSGDAVLLAVPGNHDLFRREPKDEDNPALDTLLDKDGFARIADKFWTKSAGSYRHVINDAFAAYSEWWNDAPYRPSNLTGGALPGDFACTLDCGPRRIGVIGLNTTFLQLGEGDYKERLVWDARQIHTLCDNAGNGAVDDWVQHHDVCLLLTHQGPDWLTPEASKHGESEVAPAGRFAAHLFGHQHETDFTSTSKGVGSIVRHIQGGSVFGMEKFGEPPTLHRAHGYSVGRIEFGPAETTLRLWPRVATNKPNRWRFISDQENVELQADGGTAPEVIGPTRKTVASAIVKPTITTPAQSASPVAMPHSTLPARRSFFGRGKDLERITKWLLPEDRSWGLVIDGPGGIGKTALALEAAY
ncbi:MAG: metallophosphoesterase, partial [Gammaproteobacteria bacterium]|nr:metallophosphoesterase [Gammaproteobacteria bacterium]NNJ84702.1 hypothetical protein [Gammaproteobacteria bacterium]